MKLGELKKSLSRFPSDMDDTEIIVKYVNSDGSEDQDLLTYVAYANYGNDIFVICLGSWKSADKFREKNPSAFPDDYILHPDSTKNKDQNEKQ